MADKADVVASLAIAQIGHLQHVAFRAAMRVVTGRDNEDSLPHVAPHAQPIYCPGAFELPTGGKDCIKKEQRPSD